MLLAISRMYRASIKSLVWPVWSLICKFWSPTVTVCVEAPGFEDQLRSVSRPLMWVLKIREVKNVKNL